MLPSRSGIRTLKEEPAIGRTLEAIWRIESPRLIAGLTSFTRDLDRAEELAQDAVVAALTQWSQSGIPHNPGAWLMTAAKRRAIDEFRRRSSLEAKIEKLGNDLVLSKLEDDFERAHEAIDDDLLRLMFFACHPLLSTEARVALTLRLLGGLTTVEIARAFLVPEQTIAQRIVRAKRTLSAARVAFDVPAGDDLIARLDSVLEAIYLIFNEGYAATAGDVLVRPELVEEALRIGRVLSALLPQQAEVHGLVALMEIQASRLNARIGPSGEPIVLADQDRGKWDYLAIGRGLKALARAESSGKYGRYTVQAEIAACHARSRSIEQTDWESIVRFYDALLTLAPSPVVRLNRAVSIGMACGPQAALDIVDGLADDPALRHYHLLPAVRADLLQKLKRHGQAREEFERAANLALNSRDRAFLLTRADVAAKASADP